MTEEKREIKPRYGTVNFEKRKHPRFSVDLPVEYGQTDLSVDNGRAMDASEGGLLLRLPEQIDIGKRLRLKLFFAMGSELHAVETLVEAVWTDIHLEKDWGDYRTGVRFVEISTEDMSKLKKFLKNLSSP
ncbi:MAG: PilZ domain-containing protein [Thermodesulfobacteriota bacterium]|jgi:c-di-GMP-binding flagellar brake protein YcgR